MNYSTVNSLTVRAALKARGLEHVVEKVSSGTKATHVTLSSEHRDQNEAVLAVLRNLWDDGEYRVHETIRGSIWISRAHYWMTKHGTHRHPAALVERFTDLQRAYIIWLARGGEPGNMPHAISSDEVRALAEAKLIHLPYGAQCLQLTEDGMKVYWALMGGSE